MHVQEQGRGRERERERERERKFQAASTLSAEPDTGLNLTNHEIVTWAEIKSRMLNQLSHPGAPIPRPFEQNRVIYQAKSSPPPSPAPSHFYFQIYMHPLARRNQREHSPWSKSRQKETMNIWEEKGSLVNKCTHHQIFTRVSTPKEIILQVFSPTNLNLEKERSLQAEILETDVMRILILSEVPGFLSSSSPPGRVVSRQ